MLPIRFRIHLTYRCNLNCEYCVQFVDKLKYDEDTDITIRDLVDSARILKFYNIQISLLRITGGEPTLHPLLKECCEVIANKWESHLNVVFSNGQIPVQKIKGMHYSISEIGDIKKVNHKPPMISPFDLGIEPVFGFTIPCTQMNRCGRLFDTYGFSYCASAGSIGRLIGIDPYHSKPVMLGIPEMCQHCPWSLSKSVRVDLAEKVKEGKIKYPTNTYREGLERQLDDPFFFKKFIDRTNNN